MEEANAAAGRVPPRKDTAPEVLYITAQTPYGPGEVWALDEMLSLVTKGCRLSVAPRTAKGAVFHPKAKEMLDRCVSAPLISSKVAVDLIHAAWEQPAFLAEAVRWTRRKSVDWNETLKGWAVLPKALHMSRALDTRHFDHIHAHSTTTVAVLGWTLARQLGCGFSYTLHSSFPLESPHAPRERIRRQFEVLTDSAAFVRTISKRIADMLVALIGERYAPKVHVLPLGVDCGVERRQPVGRKTFQLVTPAVLMAHKGHATAIKACQILRERGISDFAWDFCGDGPLRAELESQIVTLGLIAHVRLLGNIPNDQILERYGIGDVDSVVLPCIAVNGIHEGIPHALMQAMSYRIPVISTDSGSTLELIGEGAGIFVPQKDPVALADAIQQLMATPAYRERQGVQGYERVRKSFNKDETARVLMELFSR